jgi:hypothetical protein
LRSALDGGIGGDGIGSGIALRSVPEANRYAALGPVHDCVRDADGNAAVEARAKVGVEVAFHADGSDIGVGVGVGGEVVNGGVPDVVAGENGAGDGGWSGGLGAGRGGEEEQRYVESAHDMVALR